MSNATELTKALKKTLADTYAVYLKTQNFHWNVEGPMFFQLHGMFEGQYDELAEAVDTLAERLRALKVPAPGSFSAFKELTTIEDANTVPSASEMVRTLLSDHETVLTSIKALGEAAAAAGDDGTEDLATERRLWHEKTAWMLRATAQS